MNFLDRTHVWMLVFSCRSVATQLSKKSWKLHFYLKILSLGNDHGTFSMVVVSNTAMVIWWLPLWTMSAFQQRPWWTHYDRSLHHDCHSLITVVVDFNMVMVNFSTTVLPLIWVLSLRSSKLGVGVSNYDFFPILQIRENFWGFWGAF